MRFLPQVGFIASLVALSACSGGGSGPSNPPVQITATTVEATLAGAAQSGVTVTESTSVDGAPGTAITTGVTNGAGQVDFTGLTPGTAYCWSWGSLSGHVIDTHLNCTSGWAGTIVIVGNSPASVERKSAFRHEPGRAFSLPLSYISAHRARHTAPIWIAVGTRA
jgi:hypothetical protein